MSIGNFWLCMFGASLMAWVGIIEAVKWVVV